MKTYEFFSKKTTEQKIIDYLDSFMKRMKIKFGSKDNPTSLYYYKDDMIYLELETELGTLWMDNYIWSKLEEFYPEIGYRLRNEKIQIILTKYMAENQNLKNIKSYSISSKSFEEVMKILNKWEIFIHEIGN